MAPLFLGFMVIHLVEDWSWMAMARYTTLPVYYLLVGTVLSAGLMTLWAGRKRDG